MKTKILFLLTCDILLTQVGSSLTVEYYENLINHTLKKADSYILPENNKEFIIGIQSQRTLDFGCYDFIIVGAGAAGSVLATRLSEVADFTVLLLEAGGEEDDFNQIMSFALTVELSERNWGYQSTTQPKSCLGMNKHRCNVPRGKSIGGSTAINGMMYLRGSAKDYDKWEEMGNFGWSYKDVLPYFIKSENSQVMNDPGYHGKGGLWNIEYTEPPSPLLSTFFEATREMNISIIDVNGRTQFGASEMPYSLKRGKRQSTGTAFLNNARARRNLKVLTNVLVTKVIIDPDSKIAEGVEFVTRSKKFRAVAKKEVIVSGGAINSPQLLMLSGVGPQNHLKELGIEVIVDLSVGLNLQEHPLFAFMAFRTNYTIESKGLSESVEMYLNGVGPLTRAWGINGVGFLHNNTEEVPNIEYIFAPPGGLPDPNLGPSLNFNSTVLKELAKINSSTDVQILLILLHEKSRGQITLKSKNPLDFPNIDLNILDKKEDVDALVEGIEFVLKLMDTQAFRAINATALDFSFCSEFEKHSKEYWSCMLRVMTTTVFHPCGTTRMGPDPKNSVVNSDLKVHGMQRLRVVDAGIIPSTISGHTAAATIMIAEKISDAIKREYASVSNV